MRFWGREIVGWLMLGFALIVFNNCFELLERGKLFEAGPASLIGIIVFRGGIHLLKVAVAARVCMQVQEEAAKPAATGNVKASPPAPKAVAVR